LEPDNGYRRTVADAAGGNYATDRTADTAGGNRTANRSANGTATGRILVAL